MDISQVGNLLSHTGNSRICIFFFFFKLPADCGTQPGLVFISLGSLLALKVQDTNVPDFNS